MGAQVHDLAGLRQLVVKTTPGGAPVRLSDVATVEPSTMPVYTAVTANGRNAVLLSITRQPSSNTVAVADAVASEVAELQQKLPPGVKLELFYDQSQLVRDSISSVRDAICIGLALACVILFLFLRDWTSALIAGLVIPVTIAITIGALWIIGESFNLMTLGGMAAAIGLIIDDAIVVVENIVMHRDAGEHRADAVRKALKELTVPLLGSTITPVVVFLPLVAVSGVTGVFFRASRHHHDRGAADLAGAGAHLDARAELWCCCVERSSSTEQSTASHASEAPAACCAAFCNFTPGAGVGAGQAAVGRRNLRAPGSRHMGRVSVAGHQSAARHGRGRLHPRLHYAGRAAR